jgi:REP element-mobilizing transposase RayT
VWGTKNRHPFLVNEVKLKVINHIKENAKNKQIHIDCIDGHHEHLHCLIALNADMNIAKVMQLLKGESAYWINKNKVTSTKFEWADEYFAISVSESIVEKVRKYIHNQEEHHSKITFTQEYETFIKNYNFSNHG